MGDRAPFAIFCICSSAELTVIVSNLSCHAKYIQGTTHFLLTHIQSNPDLLGPHMEPIEAKKLTSKLSESVGAVQRLRREVTELQMVAESVSTYMYGRFPLRSNIRFCS